MINWQSLYKLFEIPAALIMGCFFLSGCENEQKDINALIEKRVMKEEGIDIESYLSQQGVLKARLTAPLMVRYQTDTAYAEFPKTLYVEFYDDSVMVESWLTAKYGKYYEQLNKVFLRDSVVVINREGDTLRTPELWWDQNLQKFYTDKPAKLDGPDKHLIGNDGLDATQDLRSIIFKAPTGTFERKE